MDTARQVHSHLTEADSLRVGRALLAIDSVAAVARADSAYCALPLVARLMSDTTVVRVQPGQATFRWADVSPGTYRLEAFRDLNKNGRPEEGEPFGAFNTALTIKPLRTLDSLNVILKPPAKKP